MAATNAPKENRARRNAPERGDWQSADGSGWQHGPIPDPPPKMLKASVETWGIWFSAWFAAHWGPEDVPQIRQAIRIYDQVERGEFQRSAELRLWLDTIGVSKKGQQDRRWKKPAVDAASTAGKVSGRKRPPAGRRFEVVA